MSSLFGRGSSRWILTDEGLPLASSARVTSELRVGLETELAAEGRLDLTLVAARAGEERTTELRLDEELSVEELRRRVEGGSGDRGVDVVGRGDSVATGELSARIDVPVLSIYLRAKESHNLFGGKATRIIETLQDAVDGVEGLWDGQVGRGLGGIRTADEHRETRSTRTVADTDGTSELDATGRMSRMRCRRYAVGLQVSRGDVVALDERALFVDDLVDTVVRVEVGLDVVE